MTRVDVIIAAIAIVLATGTVRGGDDAHAVAPPERFSPEQREHWSFRPVSRPAVPTVVEGAWPRNPCDAFVLKELESLHMAHAPEADRVALIRRLRLDLTGLPPTPEEVAAFLADRRPDAYERLVDRLLDSPQFGERWAQHWLDLAHYADSNGFELDAERPDAWRYRDWVVRALNDDMPYDQFLTLQLAGDEARPGDPDALIATGFARSGPREVVSGNIDPAVKRQSELTEITGTVGSVVLGLTMACARCHDHKFDPIPTTDYYRLQSFFAATEYVDRPIANDAEKAAHAAATKAVDAKLAPLKKSLDTLEGPYRKRLRAEKEARLNAAERAALETPREERSPLQKKLVEGTQTTLNVTWEELAAEVAKHPADHAERERLKRAIHDVEITRPRPIAHAMALVDRKVEAPDTFVFRRGDVKNPGPKVAPRPTGILLASQPPDAFADPTPTAETTGRRLALARWLTRADNPLTARVIVNRLWQHHFGRGLVATPSDFGARGEDPSHPELLDWLAAELVADGWRLKPIHRLMVTSSAYRQASNIHTYDKKDPENSFLWRMNRRRLDAEALRDAMLAASGELNPKMGGPGVLAPIEEEVEELIFTEAEVVDLWPETPDPAEHARRSLYLFRKRNVRYPLLDAFDAPDTQNPCPVRPVSTHALQPLMLLNSDFALGRARALAGRVLRESASDLDARVARATAIVLGRGPRPDELARARSFLASQADLLRPRDPATLAAPTYLPPGLDPAEAAAWVDFASAMLNRNEFLYVP
ncbi:MAG TPA: DUF1549 and DUF1553 domain-containing protein [Isosphaeraceae bacterium]|jgi:hypothetical protein|nr:DUF1549 and DUF1553 domain-containing protein [Isosphaeraceae bacterium]